MKSIQPLVDLVVQGVPLGPDSDPIMLDNEAADALIEAGQGELADDLDSMKLDELKAVAATEGVTTEGLVRKAEFAKAIRDHRALAAG